MEEHQEGFGLEYNKDNLSGNRERSRTEKRSSNAVSNADSRQKKDSFSPKRRSGSINESRLNALA
jgi:hypothetical protein